MMFRLAVHASRLTVAQLSAILKCLHRSQLPIDVLDDFATDDSEKPRSCDGCAHFRCDFIRFLVNLPAGKNQAVGKFFRFRFGDDVITVDLTGAVDPVRPEDTMVDVDSNLRRHVERIRDCCYC